MRESSGRNCRVDGKSTCYNRRLREVPSVQSTVLTESAVDRLATRLRPESRITVVTGAGVSAASGIPTFRGPGGLWRTYRPEQLATPEAFRRDPSIVWEWYDWRRQQVAACQPNAAHHVLAAWSQQFDGFTVITQNVDGLHERAGTRDVIRFHGSIWELRCWKGCAEAPRRWRDETTPFPRLPPPCPHCGGLTRPGVVWFGEAIDNDVISRSLEATDCDLFLTVGTSALVHPAASLLREAKKGGAFTVEINLEPTPASDVVDLSLQGPAARLLTDVDEARHRHDS